MFKIPIRKTVACGRSADPGGFYGAPRRPRSSRSEDAAVYITQIRLSTGGSRHEHITDVKWRNPTTGETGQSTRAAMVDWINRGGAARVRDAAGHDVRVGVFNANPPYIRTYADDVWTDNLLALPRF